LRSSATFAAPPRRIRNGGLVTDANSIVSMSEFCCRDWGKLGSLKPEFKQACDKVAGIGFFTSLFWLRMPRVPLANGSMEIGSGWLSLTGTKRNAR